MSREFSSSDRGIGILLDLPQLGGAPALIQKQTGFVYVFLLYSFLDVGLRSTDSQAGLSEKNLD